MIKPRLSKNKLVLLIYGLCCLSVLPFAFAAPRVVTSDWATAETLVAMGHPPVGLGDKRMYQNWVSSPAMPDKTLDIGLRFQPNLERLYQMNVDMFIQTDWFSHLKPQFAKIAPVHEVAFAGVKGIDYATVLAATRQLGELIGDVAAAEDLIEQANSQLAAQKELLSLFRERPLAVVQFVDARHLRIYSNTSLYQTTIDQLGLENAWQGSANQWGFANISLADLAELPPQTLLIIVKPNPVGLSKSLQKSLLWQRLPFANPDNHRIIEPSWSYGALPSIQRFARQLADKLPQTRSASEAEPW